MLVAILLILGQQPLPAMVVSMPFIKADTICKNNQNETDKTLFSDKCLDNMAKNYKPVKIYYAMYGVDGKEDIIPLGTVSCIYITKNTIYARCEFDVAPPKNIKDYICNAKPYAGKGDFDFSDNCIYTINKAEIKYFVLRPKNKAIIFE
jgi:hypothetical protein